MSIAVTWAAAKYTFGTAESIIVIGAAIMGLALGIFVTRHWGFGL